jgi:mannose-6-phosphate isomerase-like protein (cupin superfamily)
VPVIRTADATVYELNDTTFTSYAHPSRGSTELCGWRVEVGPNSTGVAHRVSHEEVFLVLSGTAEAVLDGERQTLAAGDVLVVPVGAAFHLDNPGDQPLSAWVTTRVGLRATMADGTEIAPPWAGS